jgi:ABC-type sulfate/molybdate transport systems ATPase subunit
VLRNVELPLRWRRVPRPGRGDVALAALERLRVRHLADRPAYALSGGEQQRVSLARALAVDPDVLLLDEPAVGLDAESRSAFLADLDEALADRATTVVHVSHRADEAFRLAGTIVVLVDGRVHQVGSVEEVHRSPLDADVASLVGYENILGGRVLADGTVEVGGSATGLVHDGPRGPATVAVFANGVRLRGPGSPGLPARVTHVGLGAGHRSLALRGAVPLVASVPLDARAPAVGELVQVSFDRAFSAVVAKVPLAARGTAGLDQAAMASSSS